MLISDSRMRAGESRSEFVPLTVRRECLVTGSSTAQLEELGLDRSGESDGLNGRADVVRELAGLVVGERPLAEVGGAAAGVAVVVLGEDEVAYLSAGAGAVGFQRIVPGEDDGDHIRFSALPHGRQGDDG